MSDKPRLKVDSNGNWTCRAEGYSIKAFSAKAAYNGLMKKLMYRARAKVDLERAREFVSRHGENA